MSGIGPIAVRFRASDSSAIALLTSQQFGQAEGQQRLRTIQVRAATIPLMERLALFALALLSGCSLIGASDKPEAVDIGGGRYSVTGTTLSSYVSSARQDATDRALAFCRASSRQVVIESFADKASGGASSAVFYCK